MNEKDEVEGRFGLVVNNYITISLLLSRNKFTLNEKKKIVANWGKVLTNSDYLEFMNDLNLILIDKQNDMEIN